MSVYTHRSVRGLVALIVAARLIAAAREARADGEDAFRAELGSFYATFTKTYGHWFGATARFWLLDSTGLRRTSGYLDVIDLHWKPDAPTLGSSSLHSTFVMGRLMHHWSPSFYTMTTLGATAFSPVFPRVQVETELNAILPQVTGLVFSFGAGDRYYPTVNRPYLVLGASYALPRMSVSYRYWYGAGITSIPTQTHLITLAYGARLAAWLRIDLLWGDESFRSGVLFDTDMNSRGISVTLEKWLTPHIGVLLNPEYTEISVDGRNAAVLHRTQLLVRGFYTF
jgi:YaiO family outer membrane protein